MTPIILDFIAHHARVMPNKVVATELVSNRNWTYAEFDRAARRAEWVLKARDGFGTGERVAMLSRNSMAMLIVQLACIRSGAIFVPLNFRLAAPEIAFLVADCRPFLLIHEGACDALVSDEISCPRLRIGEEIDELAEAMAEAPEPLNVGTGLRFDPERVITILYSSGTTGRPKGALVTMLNGFTGGLGLALGTRVTAESAFLIDMPLFHTAGLFGASWAAMIMGARVNISQKFDAPLTYQRLIDPGLNISHYFSVTQMAMMLRQVPGFDGRKLAKLTAYITGGSPNPEAHHRRWLDEGVTMSNGWGMSETCSSTALPVGDLELLRAKAGSAGLPHLSVEMKIVDEDGRENPNGEVGEIWIRGATVSPGYWERPALNATAFVDGWFKTGDAAFRDDDGYFTLVDRIKDMYISGGENVYPAEVEAAITELHDIGEVAVLGVADERWGEVGYAFVVPRAGASLTPGQVTDHCLVRLARYKVPKFVFIVDAIERTASGKVQKHILRERLAQLSA
ncbi:MAG: AMP-binding protein [Janthinobacterium lividum]